MKELDPIVQKSMASWPVDRDPEGGNRTAVQEALETAVDTRC